MRKLIILLSGIALLAFIPISCEKDSVVQKPDTPTPPTKGTYEDGEVLRDSILYVLDNEGIDSAKIVWHAFTKTERYALWFYKLTQAKNELSGAKQDYVATILDTLSLTHFELGGATAIRVDGWFVGTLDEAFSTLGTDVAAQVFLDPHDYDQNRQAANPWAYTFECECNADSDYCGWPFGSSTCDVGDCSVDAARGCGFLWRYACEGSCN